MGFPMDIFDKFFPPPTVEVSKKQAPPPKDDRLKMNCIRSEKCKEFKMDLQTCQTKLNRIVVPRGETCDQQILNFINCFEECMLDQKDVAK